MDLNHMTVEQLSTLIISAQTRRTKLDQERLLERLAAEHRDRNPEPDTTALGAKTTEQLHTLHEQIMQAIIERAPDAAAGRPDATTLLRFVRETLPIGHLELLYNQLEAMSRDSLAEFCTSTQPIAVDLYIAAVDALRDIADGTIKPGDGQFEAIKYTIETFGLEAASWLVDHTAD